MDLKMGDEGMRMPPGYRFYPTEEELVGFYLRERLGGRRNKQLQHLIPVLHIYDHHPWELPKLAGAQCQQDPQLQEWFFFIPRQEKEARGGRPNRLTSIGYWKATGSPGYVYSSDNRIIGEKRTMVFYKGRAPGVKTDWKMNEYRAIDHSDSAPQLRLEFSLCRVYIRSKCIRSYDRRPSSSVPGAIRRRGSSSISPLLVADHQHQSITSPSYHRQNPPKLVTMNNGDGSGSSSRENSSSSDDQTVYNVDDVHQSEEHASERTPSDGSNMGIFDMGDAPLWEWEQYLNPAAAEWMVI